MSKFLDCMKETKWSDVDYCPSRRARTMYDIDAVKKIVAEGIAKVIILGDPGAD